MRLGLVALAVIGVAGVIVAIVAHLAVLLGGGAPAWREPIAAWLTGQAVACIGLLAVIRLLKRDWVWANRRWAVREWRWPRGWPRWSKWLVGGHFGYGLVQWVREGGPSPLAITGMWMFADGNILLASLTS